MTKSWQEKPFSRPQNCLVEHISILMNTLMQIFSIINFSFYHMLTYTQYWLSELLSTLAFTIVQLAQEICKAVCPIDSLITIKIDFFETWTNVTTWTKKNFHKFDRLRPFLNIKIWHFSQTMFYKLLHFVFFDQRYIFWLRSSTFWNRIKERQMPRICLDTCISEIS